MWNKRSPREEVMVTGAGLIGPALVEQARADVIALGDPPAWQAARLRQIDRIVYQTGWNLESCTLYGAGSIDALHQDWASARWSLVLVARPNWLPERPPRRMPSMKRIVAYWVSVGEPFQVEVDHPECFRCLSTAPGWLGSYFDRAHLVDRQVGGLDHPGNMVPLCNPCHRMMPMFEIDEGRAAIDWVLEGLEPMEMLARAARASRRRQAG